MKFNQQITTQVYSIEEAGGVEFVEDRMKELKIQEISLIRAISTYFTKLGVIERRV